MRADLVHLWVGAHGYRAACVYERGCGRGEIDTLITDPAGRTVGAADVPPAILREIDRAINCAWADRGPEEDGRV